MRWSRRSISSGVGCPRRGRAVGRIGRRGSRPLTAPPKPTTHSGPAHTQCRIPRSGKGRTARDMGRQPHHPRHLRKSPILRIVRNRYRHPAQRLHPSSHASILRPPTGAALPAGASPPPRSGWNTNPGLPLPAGHQQLSTGTHTSPAENPQIGLPSPDREQSTAEPSAS